MLVPNGGMVVRVLGVGEGERHGETGENPVALSQLRFVEDGGEGMVLASASVLMIVDSLCHCSRRRSGLRSTHLSI